MATAVSTGETCSLAVLVSSSCAVYSSASAALKDILRRHNYTQACELTAAPSRHPASMATKCGPTCFCSTGSTQVWTIYLHTLYYNRLICYANHPPQCMMEEKQHQDGSPCDILALDIVYDLGVLEGNVCRNIAVLTRPPSH